MSGVGQCVEWVGEWAGGKRDREDIGNLQGFPILSPFYVDP